MLLSSYATITGTATYSLTDFAGVDLTNPKLTISSSGTIEILKDSPMVI